MLKFKCTDNIILVCLFSVYMLSHFVKGVTGANGLVCRDRGLLLVRCWVERSGGCRLWEKGPVARNEELGCAESRQPGVSGDKKQSFLGSREGISVCCSSESC